MKVLLRVARIVALVYIGLTVFLVACQNKLLYPASRDTSAALLKSAELEGLEPWKDSSGAIIGWHTKNATAKQRIVVFHGNAGYALHRTYYTEALSRLGWPSKRAGVRIARATSRHSSQRIASPARRDLGPPGSSLEPVRNFRA